MYFHPDNIVESIVIVSKGKFDHRKITEKQRESSRIELDAFLDEKWYMNYWEISNVLPSAKLEKDIAAFPEEIARRLICLYSYVGETVLDPFLGSGTTMKVARNMMRNSIGVEIRRDLVPVIRDKVGFEPDGEWNGEWNGDWFEVGVG